MLSYELGMAATIDGKADFLIEFKKFVRRVYGSQKRLLVIIDEAQRLTNGLIDEIRVLSSIDYDNRELVNIFFVGQIEFNQMLTDPCNKALRQRISVSYHLVPFNPDETRNLYPTPAESGWNGKRAFHARGHSRNLQVLKRHPQAHQHPVRPCADHRVHSRSQQGQPRDDPRVRQGTRYFIRRCSGRLQERTSD